MDNTFDFLCDIILHVGEVQENIEEFTSELKKRGLAHDRTKFLALEFDAFVSTREDFKRANYGSEEYKRCVDEAHGAVVHHHENNRHHTHYHKNGIDDMNMIDIIEMVCDWKAASRRSPDMDFAGSIDHAFKKYGVGKQLGRILKNTFEQLGWIKPGEPTTAKI